MGQYYKLVNLDKKEVINPWDAGGCGKLGSEWQYPARFIPLLLANDSYWKGNRLAMIGDNTKEYEIISKKPYKDITKKVVEIFKDYFV